MNRPQLQNGVSTPASAKPAYNADAVACPAGRLPRAFAKKSPRPSSSVNNARGVPLERPNGLAGSYRFSSPISESSAKTLISKDVLSPKRYLD